MGNQVIKAEPLEITAGGWAVLHSLRALDSLNGLLVRVCGWQRPCWWEQAPAATEPRLHVQLAEDLSLHLTGRLRVRPDNLHPVRPEEGVGRCLQGWLDSGPRTATFAIPVWEALQDCERTRHRTGLGHGP